MGAHLADRVADTIAQRQLFAEGGPVVVAVSGGQDSVCLLHVLSEVAVTFRLSLHVAHIDHGFRPGDATAESALVAAHAAALGWPITTVQRECAAVARRLHLSKQEAARRARFMFLEGLAEEIGARAIAVGHTRDDRVETILLNLIRGTGPEGLAALPYSRRLVRRPLLDVRRTETRDYCLERRLAFAVDPTNSSRVYRRNRLRLDVIPTIEAHFNPRVQDALVRLADIVDTEQDYLELATQEAMRRLVLARDSPGPPIDRQALTSLHPALQRRIIRGLLLPYLDAGTVLELDDCDDVIRAASEPGPWSRTLPGGRYRVIVDRALVVEEIQSPTAPLRVRRELPLPGEVAIGEFGCVIRAEIATTAHVPVASATRHVARVDADMLGGQLVVRNRQPGDRFRPVGMAHARKLQDYLVDRKVPRLLRDRLPLLEAAGRIVWVAGYDVADDVAVGPCTRTVCVLTVEPSATNATGSP